MIRALSKYFSAAKTFLKYSILRPVYSEMQWLKIRNKFKSINYRENSGRPLSHGITFCLVSKNEEHTLPYCLESVARFADQIICVDNGSSDASFQKLKEFQQDNPKKSIRIVHYPDKPLVTCRQLAADNVNTTYFIRGDADMLFTDQFCKHAKSLIRQNRPFAVRLSYLDLFGDPLHCCRFYPYLRGGEYYLRSYEKGIRYVEYNGRLEHAALPHYFKMCHYNGLGFLHLDCLKANERWFYRTAYLDHRQFLHENHYDLPFSEYYEMWKSHVFETPEAELQEFAMGGIIAQMCRQLPVGLINQYPNLIEIHEKSPYRVFYRDGNPYFRGTESAFKQFDGIQPNGDFAGIAETFFNDHHRRFFEQNIRRSNVRA